MKPELTCHVRFSLQDERRADCHRVSVCPEGAVCPPHAGCDPQRHQERLHPPHSWWTGMSQIHRTAFFTIAITKNMYCCQWRETNNVLILCELCYELHMMFVVLKRKKWTWTVFFIINSPFTSLKLSLQPDLWFSSFMMSAVLRWR